MRGLLTVLATQETIVFMLTHGVIHTSRLQPDACWACMGTLHPRQIIGSSKANTKFIGKNDSKASEYVQKWGPNDVL